jgi:hypothetical protein
VSYSPQRRTDTIELGQSRALETLKKPLLQALLASRLRGLQMAEDALWEVVDYRNLDDGFGVILDSLGRIVGRGRDGQSDADFKISIQIQIIQNRASGVTSEYLAIGELLQPGAGWAVIDQPPASFLIVAGTTITDPARAAREFEAIRALGTGMTLLVPPPAPSAALRWGWSGDAGIGIPGAGWSSDDTVGGRAGYTL